MNLFYVLVPIYKVEPYIRDCISSVLNQTYQHFRLVLVDDGSPDQSGAICDEYAQKDSRIHVIHQTNQGLISARQTANRYVKEQTDWLNSYVVYLDSDDSLKSNALEALNHFIETQQCDMVIYGMDRVCNGKVVEKFDYKKSYIGVVTDKRILYKTVFGNSAYNSLCRKVISAKLLSDVDYSQLYSIRRGEDLIQSIAYYERSEKVGFIQESLYNYTVNPSSITHSIKYENYRVNSTVRKMVWDFLKSQQVWNEKDFDEYLLYLRQLLNNEIKMISRFDAKPEDKWHLYDDICSDEYYRMVLESRKSTDKLLNLLASGNYRLLDKAANRKSWLKVVYRYIRGFEGRKR